MRSDLMSFEVIQSSSSSTASTNMNPAFIVIENRITSEFMQTHGQMLESSYPYDSGKTEQSWPVGIIENRSPSSKLTIILT